VNPAKTAPFQTGLRPEDPEKRRKMSTLLVENCPSAGHFKIEKVTEITLLFFLP